MNLRETHLVLAWMLCCDVSRCILMPWIGLGCIYGLVGMVRWCPEGIRWVWFCGWIRDHICRPELICGWQIWSVIPSQLRLGLFCGVVCGSQNVSADCTVDLAKSGILYWFILQWVIWTAEQLCDLHSYFCSARQIFVMEYLRPSFIVFILFSNFLSSLGEVWG